MKRFLAIYTGAATAADKAAWDEKPDAEQKDLEQRGMEAWMAWGARHANAIVENGGPLGRTKRAGRDGITDIQNNMTGYVIVQAESHEAAARMFEDHPHFAIFPGEAVEIMEELPLPQS